MTSDLESLIQQSSQRNRISYQQKQLKQQKQRDRQTPHATKLDYAAEVGLDKVQLSNGSVIYAEPVTNGAIGVGDSVELHRGSSARIDQMPHQKRVAAKQVKPQPQYGKIKILYSTSELDENGFTTHVNLWIAGDGRTKPHQVIRYDPNDFFLSGINLCNTGPGINDWIVTYSITERATNISSTKIISPQSQVNHPASRGPIGGYVGGGFYTFPLSQVAIREIYVTEVGSYKNSNTDGGSSYVREYENGTLVSNIETGRLFDGKYTFSTSSKSTYGIDPHQKDFASGSGSGESGSGGYGYRYSTDSGGSNVIASSSMSASATFFSSAFSLSKGLQKAEGSQTQQQSSNSHIISLREDMDGGPDYLNSGKSSHLEHAESVILLSPYLSEAAFYEQKGTTTNFADESSDLYENESSTTNYLATPILSGATGKTALVSILDRTSRYYSYRNGQDSPLVSEGTNKDAYYLYSYSSQGITKTKIVASDYYNNPFNITNRFGGIDYQRINLVGSKIYSTPLEFKVRTEDFDLETETISLQEGSYTTSTKKVKIYNLKSPSADLIAFSGYGI